MTYRWLWSTPDIKSPSIRRLLNRKCQPALTTLILSDPNSVELFIGLYERDAGFRDYIDQLAINYASVWLAIAEPDLDSSNINFKPTLVCETDTKL